MIRRISVICEILSEGSTGGVFVNGFSASNPRLPVGGVKKSGYGRELSHFGLREFVNAQGVWIKEPALTASDAREANIKAD
jgi:acyl-CoA reductase-like NAD-dependent aldehyde dehydrogenase